MSNLGVGRGLTVYLFSPDSPFDLLLGMKLRCPTCHQGSCTASNSNSQECSNNPNVTVNTTPSPDPQNPSTFPHQAGGFHSTTQSYCNVPCSSQADCKCGDDYRCMQSSSVISLLTRACVYLPLSSGSNGKRDFEPSSELVTLSSRCVCNATYVGTECC